MCCVALPRCLFDLAMSSVAAAPQQQQPQRPPVSDEDVTRLQEMFPTLDTDVVRSVLEASNGQADSAVNTLLQMTAA